MRWLHIGIKDLTVTVRDFSALGILLVMPAVLILVLGTALGNLAANIEKTPLGIVNLDKGDVGARITDGFFTDAQLSKLFLATRYRSAADARAAVARGDLAGAIVVPDDFSRRLDTGKPSQLLLYTDPGREIAGTIIRSVSEAVSTRVSAASIAARTSAFYVSNMRVNDYSFVGPGDRRGRAERHRDRRLDGDRARRDDGGPRQGHLEPLLLRGRHVGDVHPVRIHVRRLLASPRARRLDPSAHADDPGNARRHRRRQDARGVPGRAHPVRRSLRVHDHDRRDLGGPDSGLSRRGADRRPPPPAWPS